MIPFGKDRLRPTFALVLTIITTITKTSTKTAAASSPSLVAQPFSNDHQYHLQANTFRLTADQCPHLATIFTAASGLTGATYLDSCSARFLRLDRLYDDALLLGVSLAGWHHGRLLLYY